MIFKMKMMQFYKRNCLNTFRTYCTNRKTVILGIETSCDDTGCGVVDSEGNILGEALNSQVLIHLKHGGIIPPLAENLHREHIENVVNEALKASKLTVNDVDAIATTVKPDPDNVTLLNIGIVGMPRSLAIGLKYGKHLCKTYNKPFIPIHHMEAHALTARMSDHSVKFPFLVLLISGGHCLLAIAQDVDKFLLMGQTIDDAPGEVFDKMARQLQFRNIPEFSQLSGGQAIELAASRASNFNEFIFTPTLFQYRDCNFSFAGIKNQFYRHIVKQEKQFDLPPDAVIPGIYNVCAAFQLVVTKHICHRVQRGIEYAAMKRLIPPNQQTLVVSGGVACNNFIASGLQILCDQLDYRFVRPPPKLTTDNGVMIAWNGIERWNIQKGVMTALDYVETENSCPLGESIINDVTAADLKPTWIKVGQLLSKTHLVQHTCEQ